MRGTWQTTEGGGGGAGSAIGVIIAAVVAVAIAGPVVSAAVSLLETLLIALVIGVAVTGAGVVAFVAFRLRRSQPRATPAPWRAQVLPPAAQQVPTQQCPALDPPREVHLHFYNVSAEDIAAITARHGNGEDDYR